MCDPIIGLCYRTEMSLMKAQSLLNRVMAGSLVLQISIGLVAGVALSLLAPDAAKASMLLGNLFVQALKAVAPILVLVTSLVRWQQRCWRSR